MKNKGLYWVGLLLIASILCISFMQTSPVDIRGVQLRELRSPAEYQKQDALWFIWNPYDHKIGESNAKVLSELIEITHKSQKVVLSVADSTVYKDALKHIDKEVRNHPNFSFAFIPSIQFWARDMGPVFTVLEDGKLAIADFNFNLWGYGEPNDPDNLVEEAFDRNVAEYLELPVITSKMISEGGNREINSQGILITVERVEAERNPDMSISEMENEYKRLLGVQKTIWLKEGLKEDEHTFLGPIETAEEFRAYTTITTNGHVDEFARFVNDSTILLAEVDEFQLASGDPIALENHKRLEVNYQILKEATDLNGKKFSIIRMPMPDPIFEEMGPGDDVYEYIKTLDYQSGIKFPDGEEIKVVAAASYLNFIIANEVVIGQRYCRDECSDRVKILDQKAQEILQNVFPERKVYMVDALAVNLGGGGIHCITIHQPNNSQ